MSFFEEILPNILKLSMGAATYLELSVGEREDGKAFRVDVTGADGTLVWRSEIFATRKEANGLASEIERRCIATGGKVVAGEGHA